MCMMSETFGAHVAGATHAVNPSIASSTGTQFIRSSPSQPLVEDFAHVSAKYSKVNITLFIGRRVLNGWELEARHGRMGRNVPER